MPNIARKLKIASDEAFVAESAVKSVVKPVAPSVANSPTV